MLIVGAILYGFCNGEFGRDSYDDKRIEAVGVDWVVARNKRGEPEFACGSTVHEDLEPHTYKKQE